MQRLLHPFRDSILHPQWLSLRYHALHRCALRTVQAGTALDIGSGDSDHRRYVHPAAAVIRLDHPATNARYRIPPDVYADACRLPIAGASVDAVLLFEVIEHVADDRLALDEIRRVLKPAGRLYLSAPFLYPEHDVPGDYRRYTVYGLKHLLIERGLRVIEERRHGNSFVVALQLLNLALLEFVRDLYLRHWLLGALAGALVYPLCLTVNLLALPFVKLSGGRASSFGWSVVAVKE